MSAIDDLIQALEALKQKPDGTILYAAEVHDLVDGIFAAMEMGGSSDIDITTEQIEGGTRVTITDADGTEHSFDVKDGDNPFKGWFDNLISLQTITPVIGDYGYVKGATTTDPVKIYECTTAGTWSDSGREVDTSNVQTFADGKQVNSVGIDETNYSFERNNLPTSVVVVKNTSDFVDAGIEYYPKLGFIMSSSLTYVSNATSKLVFVGVLAGKKYRIKASANTTDNARAVYALVKNNTIANNQAIPFCDGDSERHVVYAGDEIFLYAPSDCKYIVMTVVTTGGVDVMPVVERVDEKQFVMPDSMLNVVPSKDLPSTTLYPFAIGAEMTWVNGYADGCSLTEVPSNAKKVRVRQGTYCVFAFLKNFNPSGISAGSAVPFCDGTNRYSVAAVYTTSHSVEVEVPSDAKYLYIYRANKKLNELFVDFLVEGEGLTSNIDGEVLNGAWSELDLSSATTYNNILCGGSASALVDKWNANNNFKTGLIALPSTAKYLKITPQITNNVIFVLKNGKAPAAGVPAECAEPYKQRMSLLLGYTYLLSLTPDCKYLAYTTESYGVPQAPVVEYATGVVDGDTMATKPQCEYFLGSEITDVEFNDTPETLFTNEDFNIGTVTYPKVLKISDSMYYLWYGGNPVGVTGDNTIDIRFAYSTDGVNWVNGLPAGVTNNNPEGNGTLLIPERLGCDVVKVPDAEYPYRMVCFKWHTASYMYKSADGVNWTLIKTYPFYYDNQPSVIVRGDLLKIYFRRRDGEGRLDRYIGVVTCDLDGNVLTPPTIFFGKYYYQASASRLDDRREIMFPTYFNPVDDTVFLSCFVVDGNRIYPKEVDFSGLPSDPLDWIAIAPGIVNIGNDFYIYYLEYNSSHNSVTKPPVDNVRVQTVKRAKITFINTGVHWYPQS